MEAFLSAESAMATLFILLALGFAARKTGMVDDSFDTTLSKVVMTITCPAMILNSVLSSTESPSTDVILQILGISCITYAAVLVAAWLLPLVYRVPKRSRGPHRFTIAFGNTGFIGFAVLGAIMGGQSVLYASIYNIPYNLIMFTIGTAMMASSGDVKMSRAEQLRTVGRSLASPVMASCVIALVLALFHVTDTGGVVGKTCQMLGQMTPPASMLVIGSTMAKFNLKTMLGNVSAYITTLARLLIVPAIVFFVGSLCTSDPFLLAALVLVSAMPVASMGTIMCLTYGGDLTTMSQCTFLSTALSLVTIPLVAAFVL